MNGGIFKKVRKLYQQLVARYYFKSTYFLNHFQLLPETLINVMRKHFANNCTFENFK